ncbi:MAG: excinuclease ABC subunit UvrC [Pseudomonadota bacterium]
MTDELPATGEPSADVFDARDFLRTCSRLPGVYRMHAADGELLYVGKAKNLRNRLSSYFQKNPGSVKTEALVRRIAAIETTITATETEALLLEQQLIKQHRPPYNILLRDDKSYPYIQVTTADEFPRIAFYRGSRKAPGRYFGPYPGSQAVRETLNLLERIFRIRTCEDSFFRNRSRPCLQYQIKRCSAPCVRFIEPAEYARDVRHLLMFLEGRSDVITAELVAAMERASAALDFEQAAALRDRIAALRHVQETQTVAREGGEADILAVATQPGGSCVAVVFVRGGRVLGSKTFFPNAGDSDPAALLDEFLPQFYLGAGEGGRDVPREVILSHDVDGADALAGVLQGETGHKVRFAASVRGDRAAWLRLAQTNARQALTAHLASRRNLRQRLEALGDALALPAPPLRIECFDISHTMGEGTVASCVVFDQEGPLRREYRRFNIEGITPGDDFAAMEQVFRRRYTRQKEEGAALPDLVLIDGGAGQLAQTVAVAAELQLEGVQLVGVAKGPSRKAGLESLHMPGQAAAIVLPPDHPGLLLIQQVRDEAHRFAIAGHRARRAKKRSESPLESVPGIGPKRRRLLLNHFGGWQQIQRASAADIARVPGIDERLAAVIYQALHPA